MKDERFRSSRSTERCSAKQVGLFLSFPLLFMVVCFRDRFGLLFVHHCR